jgi:predicted RNA-binding Zn-ribbon protein involved in translation (DUF1610 family)
MGLNATRNVAVRETAVSRPLGAVLCTQCGTANIATANRCVFCLSAFPSKAAPTRAPRTASPITESRKMDLDAVFGELEAITRDDEPAVQFQCPACGRLVDEAATRCGCGVRFEDPDVVGYACPRCGTSVNASASVCRCGARFSD